MDDKERSEYMPESFIAYEEDRKKIDIYGEDHSFKHNGFEYNIVISPHTGRLWLDRNLGASRVAQSMDDNLSYGDYFQWSRAADGHEKQNSSTTDILMTQNSNNHNKFILVNTDNCRGWFDGLYYRISWTEPKNCPCPKGYRVPTIEEINKEIGYLENASDAFHSFLKIPLSGARHKKDGHMHDVGKDAYIYSSSKKENDAVCFRAQKIHRWDYNSHYANVNTANGIAVRCIDI